MTPAARVFQLNVSDGGVPKLARRTDDVTAFGLTRDRQAHPGGHGGVDRAVLLFPLEHILALQAEGHPIFPGAIGENVTVAGLDWSALRPGTRWRIGDQVLLEITRFAAPCNTIAPAFRGGDFMRVDEDRHPGWSRACARVLVPGPIRVGDPIVAAAPDPAGSRGA